MNLKYIFGKILFLTFLLTSSVFTLQAKAGEITPQEPGDAIGYFCNMSITNHSASKAQLFLKKKQDEPLWFSTIRDLFIYINSPEEDQRISAVYVNDMGQASWDNPESGTWIDAYKAYYVIDSNRRNGMGGASVVPFSSIENANKFINSYGGEIKSFKDVPESYIFSTGEFENKDNMEHMEDMPPHH